MAIIRHEPRRLRRRLNPWAELERLSEQFERLFEELLPTRRSESIVEQAWAPAVDVYETDRAYFVEMDLPGLKKDDVKITVEGNTLTIQGERKWSREIQEENLHRQERVFGRFVRTFTLPDTVDVDRIDATFQDGVLKIELPKADRAAKRLVEIK